MTQSKRNIEFINGILNSNDFTLQFKRHFKKLIKTLQEVTLGELLEMNLDFNKKLIEEGFKPDDKEIITSYGVLIVAITDEIEFRKTNDKNKNNENKTH